MQLTLELTDEQIKEVTKFVHELQIESLSLLTNKKDWNRRCVIGEPFIEFSATRWFIITDEHSEYNDIAYTLANYFPCPEYTRVQLIADGVHRMGLLERWAYKFAKGNGYTWLTEKERMNNKKCGFSVYYSIEHEEYRVEQYAFISYQNKWIKNREDAQLFCEWANEHLKPNGELNQQY